MEYIKDWEELAKINNESKTHILEVDVRGCNAWLWAKDERDYNHKKGYMRQVPHLSIYLSTHSFYDKTCKRMSKILRACGFDVELCNLDV